MSEFLALLPRSSALAAHTEFERGRESKVFSSERECVCLCAAVHLLTPIHACTQHTLTLTHTRYALNIRSAAALLCSAAAPIEIVACAAVELSVQFEQRYRAVWRPLSLSVILCKQNVFAFKVSKKQQQQFVKFCCLPPPPPPLSSLPTHSGPLEQQPQQQKYKNSKVARVCVIE